MKVDLSTITGRQFLVLFILISKRLGLTKSELAEIVELSHTMSLDEAVGTFDTEIFEELGT